jgi:acetyl-CoA C-acetyltransferase
MGEGTDEVNAELGLTREEQDVWAARSHRRAHDAWESGRMRDEIVPVEAPQRRATPLTVDRDEGIRPDTTPEALAALKPAFRADGTITAGNASQISDGACAVVVTSAERSEELGLTPLAEIVGYGMSSDRYPSLHTVPAMALERALKKSGLAASALGLVEINEAFAAVPIHSARLLGLDEEIVNVNGGAVAFGHPIGASGARIVLTLLMEMRRRGVDLGGAAICGGGGQGDALVLRRT